MPSTADLDLLSIARRASAAALRTGSGTAVTNLERLPVGESSITLTGQLESTTDSIPVVLKVAPPGLNPVRNRDVMRQARIQRSLSRVGIPVPKILFDDEGDPPMTPPFYVMERLAGDSIDPAWARDPELPSAVVSARGHELARALGRLHAVDIAGSLPNEPVITLEAEVERWSRALATADDDLREGVDACVSSLLSDVPRFATPAVTHGDFRLGNCLWSNSHLEGIIDWELWCLSDPRFDVAFLLLSFDASRPSPWRPVNGAPSAESLIACYQQEFSTSVIDDLSWFLAVARLKVAASLALLVKFDRRKPTQDSIIDAAARAVPIFIAEAHALA